MWFIYSGIDLYRKAKTKPLAKSDRYSVYGNDYLFGANSVILGVLIILVPLFSVLQLQLKTLISIGAVVLGLSMLIWKKQFTLFSYWLRHWGEFNVFGMQNTFPDLPGWGSAWIRRVYGILNLILGISFVLSGILIYFSNFQLLILINLYEEAIRTHTSTPNSLPKFVRIAPQTASK